MLPTEFKLISVGKDNPAYQLYDATQDLLYMRLAWPNCDGAVQAATEDQGLCRYRKDIVGITADKSFGVIVQMQPEDIENSSKIYIGACAESDTAVNERNLVGMSIDADAGGVISINVHHFADDGTQTAAAGTAAPTLAFQEPYYFDFQYQPRESSLGPTYYSAVLRATLYDADFDVLDQVEMFIDDSLIADIAPLVFAGFYNDTAASVLPASGNWNVLRFSYYDPAVAGTHPDGYLSTEIGALDIEFLTFKRPPQGQE